MVLLPSQGTEAGCWIRAAKGVAFLQNIRRNALGDPLRRFMDRVGRQMGMARRGFDIAVTEQLADHRQGFAERQRTRRKAVS